MAGSTVEFGSHVPASEYEFFKEHFPQYGAVKWFINSMLIEFNEQIRQNPSVKEQIDAAIQNMLETSRLIAAAAAEQQSSDD